MRPRINRTDWSASLDGNRLTAVDGFTLAYDADGNLLRKHKANVDAVVLWKRGSRTKVRRL